MSSINTLIEIIKKTENIKKINKKLYYLEIKNNNKRNYFSFQKEEKKINRPSIPNFDDSNDTASDCSYTSDYNEPKLSSMIDSVTLSKMIKNQIKEILSEDKTLLISNNIEKKLSLEEIKSMF